MPILQILVALTAAFRQLIFSVTAAPIDQSTDQSESDNFPRILFTPYMAPRDWSSCRLFHLYMNVNGARKYLSTENHPAGLPLDTILLVDSVPPDIWIYDQGSGQFDKYTFPVTTLTFYSDPAQHTIYDPEPGVFSGYLGLAYANDQGLVPLIARKMPDPTSNDRAIFTFKTPFQVCDKGALRLSDATGRGQNCLPIQDANVYGEYNCP